MTTRRLGWGLKCAYRQLFISNRIFPNRFRVSRSDPNIEKCPFPTLPQHVNEQLLFGTQSLMWISQKDWHGFKHVLGKTMFKVQQITSHEPRNPTRTDWEDIHTCYSLMSDRKTPLCLLHILYNPGLYLTWSLWLMSAPFFKSNIATEVCPLVQAMIRASFTSYAAHRW